jgi:AraC family transcriptional regulator, regulatory protein of adaptative response / DNA-3-methyladenine glycosylase II
VPGIEEASAATYCRTLRLPHAPGILELRDGRARTFTADERDGAAARAAADRLAGPDPAAADAHLRSDPILGPLIARRPGMRVPGTVDGAEIAIRAVLGQQVTLAAARTLAARLVAMAGELLPAAGDPLPAAGGRPAAAGDRSAAGDPSGALTHLWPFPEAIADAAASLPMPRARQRAIAVLAAALAAGDLVLEPGTDPTETRGRLLELPGIGPWTAEYVVMRALSDQDAWLPTDVGVRRALARLGARPEAAEAWRPYRSHAVVHLWADR